jgi:plastocyanin
MKRSGLLLGILTAVVLAASTPVLAHEDCDSGHEAKPVMAERSEGTGAQSPGGASVSIKLFQYQPGRMLVKAGTTVTWVNEDEILHTVTAEKKNGTFDAPLDGRDKRFSFTFSQPGTYAYYCDRHEHMRGEIEVYE